MTQDEWIKYGVDKGYASDATCETHNGPELTEEEEKEFDEGGDPCVPILRLW